MSAPRPRPPTPKPIYSWRSFSPTTELIYIRDAHHANTELADLGDGPLGFDLEWKPIWTKNTRENPVSLVQLASQSKIFLIQISAMSEFPAKLQQVLERADIVKAGVGIQGDVLKLYHDHGVSTCNCVDLALLARSADNARWKGKYTQPIGLARLVDTYIDLQLTKGKITRSNWEAMLSPAQQQYAANDAHSGLMLHAILSGLAESMKVPPKPVYYSFHAICGNLYDSSGVQWTPSNPDYDPGPPPPPKVPKEPKDGELESQNKGKKTNNTREPRQGPSVSDGSRGPLSTNGSGSGSTGFQAPRFEPRFPTLPANNWVVATRLDYLARPYSSQASTNNTRSPDPTIPPAPEDFNNSLAYATHLDSWHIAQEAAANTNAPAHPATAPYGSSGVHHSYPTGSLNNRASTSTATNMQPLASVRDNSASRAKHPIAPTGRNQRSWRSGQEAASSANPPLTNQTPNPRGRRRGPHRGTRKDMVAD